MTATKQGFGNYINNIKTVDNNIDEYFSIELKGRSINTQLSHIVSITKFFDIVGSINQKSITKDDIITYLNNNWFNGLKTSSQKLHVQNLRIYFKYSNRSDLVKLLKPEKFNGVSKELNKNELITREDLKTILDNSNLKLRTLCMVMYEGALRKGELLNIKLKDIVFHSDYINLF